MILKQIFRVNFEEEANKQLKRDGVYSIIYYVYYMIMILLFGLLLTKTQIYHDLGRNFSSRSLFKFLFYIPFTLVNILPIFLILKFRRQSLRSVGIKTDKILKSIIIGVIGSIPFLILNVIGPISSGKTINPNVFDWIWTFLYFFICIAFAEELMFRGFLQTRIQGLIKNKWIGIITVGILFGLMHVPFQMIKANMSLLEFLQFDMGHLITTCFIHVYLVYLYTRDNNILAPTIAHAIMNFGYAIFL